VISILTPTYNHEKYIAECIQSVLNQTFQDWEMIIVDDGSTDKTAEVISHFNDPRVRYFRQEHMGPWRLAETYNFALSKSSGEYIAILEGDDYWPEGKLEIQLQEMRNNPEAILSHGESVMISDTGREISYIPLPKGHEIISNTPTGSSLRAFFGLDLFIQAVTLVIRRDALSRIGGFQHSEIIPAVDYPTTLRLCLEGPFLPIYGQCLGYWRRHMNSISINYQMDAWKGMGSHNLRFLMEHKDDIQRLGFHFDYEEVKKKIHQKIKFVSTDHYYHEGFLFLSFKEYKLARKMFFRYCSKCGNIHMALRALVGIISSFVKIDTLPTYKDMRKKLRLKRKKDSKIE